MAGSRCVASSDAAGTLLVVEDDRALSAMLTELFIDEGYAVDVAYDGQRGLHLGLSRNTTRRSSIAACPRSKVRNSWLCCRARGVDTPVLLLTARGSVADRVDGLDAGARIIW